jgi:hypothetical protein
MSCNAVPELYLGIKERLIPVEFTARHRKEANTVKEFDQYFGKHKSQLVYIGVALSRLYLSHWPRIKELLLQADQVKAGYEILYLLFQQEALPTPTWYRQAVVDTDIEELDPVREAMLFMREDLLRVLRSHFGRDHILPSWEQRLDQVKTENILPPYILNISDRNIVVTTGLLQAMARQGKEIPGGLVGLMDRVNLLPEQATKINGLSNYKGKKTLIMSRKVFYAYSDIPTDFQDQIAPE